MTTYADSGIAGYGDIVVDRDRLYVASSNSSIVAIGLDGGGARTLAPFYYPKRLALFGNAIYWIDARSVDNVRKIAKP